MYFHKEATEKMLITIGLEGPLNGRIGGVPANWILQSYIEPHWVFLLLCWELGEKDE